MKTSTFQRGLLLAGALLVGMPLGAAAKCPDKPPQMGGYPGVWPAPRPIAYVIDGRQLNKAELEARPLTEDSIQAIHIMCWNPADSTFIPQVVTPGVNVIRIVTTGLVDRLVAELNRVSEAAPWLPTTLSTSGSPSEVRVSGAADDEVVVELTADKTQWSATLKRGAMVHRCVLDVGKPPASMTSERQRTCDFSIAEGEKHAMSTEG